MREIRGLFADENILPVGRRLAGLVEAGTVLYVGHRDIPELSPGAKDTEIFEVIGANGRDLLFITRDKKIRTRPVERRKLREAGVRALILTGRANMAPDDIYDLIITHWDAIADMDASRAGPYTLTCLRSATLTLKCKIHLRGSRMRSPPIRAAIIWLDPMFST